MSSPQSPYDPYVPSRQGAPGGEDDRHKEINRQIKETVDIMQDNLRKVGERGENLDKLQDKTENLQRQAHGFRRGANRVRKDMWWKDMKMRIWLIVGIIVLLAIIIIPAVVATRH